MKLRAATVLPACLSLLMVAPAPAEQGAAGLDPCLLVVGGTGSKAGSEQVTRFWQTVNAEIAKSLVQQLTRDGVATRLEILPQDAAVEKIPGLIALALDRERCQWLLQLTHLLGGGSGPEAFFAFEGALLGVKRTDTGFQLGPEAFRKSYRYAMTEEVLKTLSVSEVAGRLKGEVEAAMRQR